MLIAAWHGMVWRLVLVASGMVAALDHRHGLQRGSYQRNAGGVRLRPLVPYSLARYHISTCRTHFRRGAYEQRRGMGGNAREQKYQSVGMRAGKTGRTSARRQPWAFLWLLSANGFPQVRGGRTCNAASKRLLLSIASIPWRLTARRWFDG